MEFVVEEDRKKFLINRLFFMTCLMFGFSVLPLISSINSYFFGKNEFDVPNYDSGLFLVFYTLLFLFWIFLLFKEVFLFKINVSIKNESALQSTTFFLFQKKMKIENIEKLVIKEEKSILRLANKVYSINIWHKKPEQALANGCLLCYGDSNFILKLQSIFPNTKIITYS